MYKSYYYDFHLHLYSTKCGYSNFKIKNGEEIYKVEDGFLFKVKAPEGTEIEFRDSLINS